MQKRNATRNTSMTEIQSIDNLTR